MITQINMMDRDEAVALQKEESAVDSLIRQITKARQELLSSEATLATLQESLAGKNKK